MESKAVNMIKFSARGLSLLSGQLSIEASYKIASTTVKTPILIFGHFFLCKTLPNNFLISYCFKFTEGWH